MFLILCNHAGSSPRGRLGGHVQPISPEVVPEVDVNPVSFYGAGCRGQWRLELDSPISNLRIMRRVYCFRWASKSLKVFSFSGLRPFTHWPGALLLDHPPPNPRYRLTFHANRLCPPQTVWPGDVPLCNLYIFYALNVLFSSRPNLILLFLHIIF